MLSGVTTVASNNWVKCPIWCDISRLFGTRGNPILVWILQYNHMPELYDNIWDRSIHWDEINYIRPGRTMGFWKIICSIWDYKNYCCGYRWTFSGMFKKTFQETLLIPVHAVARGNHKKIINEWFHRYLNKVQKINSADKSSLHQWLQGVWLECRPSRRNWHWSIISGYWQRFPISDWPITSKVKGGYFRITTSLGSLLGFNSTYF